MAAEFGRRRVPWWIIALRYCKCKVACRLPTWGLPSCGQVQGLVAEFAGVEEV